MSIESGNSAVMGPSQIQGNSASRVLSLLHQRGTLSRAQLTRITGLNRSTIGVIIGQLVTAGLAVENAPSGDAHVGRPSPEISVSKTPLAVAVNPEIDAVTIGFVSLGGEVLRKISYPTQRIPTVSEAVNIVGVVLEGMRNELEQHYAVVGVGIAVPGLVETSKGIVRRAPHLGWENQAIAPMMHQVTGHASFVANDASLAAEAEMIFGGRNGVRNVVYLNGGASGIGGGVVSEGALLAGAGGFAGEVGHTFVQSNGTRCHCGAFGCLETEVRQQPLIELLGAEDVSAHGLMDALKNSSDVAVAAEVERQLFFLAIALRNVVNVLNPEVIVLDGFLAAIYSANPLRLEREMNSSSLPEAVENVKISVSALGADLMLIGAAELAFAELLADPLTWRAE